MKHKTLNAGDKRKLADVKGLKMTGEVDEEQFVLEKSPTRSAIKKIFNQRNELD